MLVLIIILSVALAFVAYYRRGLHFILSYLGVLKIPEDAVVFKETFHCWENGQEGRIHEFFPSNKKLSSVIIFITGISKKGLDDERLKKLARSLAYSGKVVILPEFTEFALYKMKSDEFTKLIETVALVKRKYPHLKYGIGSVCLGGIATLLALAKMDKSDWPAYIYLHGVFLDGEEMVKHCCKATPSEDKSPLEYGALPPDPFGKAVLLYNSDNFLNSLKDKKQGEETILNYIKNVEDSDSHLEFREWMKNLNKDDFEKCVGSVDYNILRDAGVISPKDFLSSFVFPKKLKIYQSHTFDDDVIPLSQGIDCFNFLHSRGANVRFVASNVGHGGEVKGIVNQLKFLKFTLSWANH